MRTAWKFLHFEDGTIYSCRDHSSWTIGKWRKEYIPTEECKGLNCSLRVDDAYSWVQGNVVAKVEYGGKVITGDRKLTCQNMRIVKAWHFTAPAWGKILRKLERIKA